MMNSTKNFAVILASLIISGSVLTAQPDLGAVGKGNNPPNRDAQQRAAKKAAREKQKANSDRLLDKLVEREATRQNQRLERIPKYLNSYGVTDEKIQQAVMTHLKTTLLERQQLSKSQYNLRRLLIIELTTEVQIKEASESLRKVEKDYETSFQKSLSELDKKVAYSKSVRLEAALLALGALDSKSIVGPS